MESERPNLIWSPQGNEDLAEIWKWGAVRFSPNAADRHLRDIYAAPVGLCATPYLGRERTDLRLGVREVVVFPTVVFYRIGVQAVEIIRVVDGRRNLAALFGPK